MEHTPYRQRLDRLHTKADSTALPTWYGSNRPRRHFRHYAHGYAPSQSDRNPAAVRSGGTMGIGYPLDWRDMIRASISRRDWPYYYGIDKQRSQAHRRTSGGGGSHLPGRLRTVSARNAQNAVVEEINPTICSEGEQRRLLVDILTPSKAVPIRARMDTRETQTAPLSVTAIISLGDFGARRWRANHFIREYHAYGTSVIGP